MSTIAKVNEALTATPETPAARPSSPTRSEEHTGRPQPVALEVPVSVNGARTIEGSDKREPFSEATKTVLIFGNGAVIRLSSTVAAGQLLFLTNEKTRKEVVCQVVKSKNYRNVSGYVELEFTEPVVGFWGMRFPSDKISSAPPAAAGTQATSAIPAAPPKPAPATLPTTPKSEPVVAISTPKISEPKPSPATPIAPSSVPVKPAEPIQAAEAKTAPPLTLEVASPIVSAPIAPVAVQQDDSLFSAPVTTPTQSVSVLSLPRTAEPPPALNPQALRVLPDTTVVEAAPIRQIPEIKVSAPAEMPAPPPSPAEDSTEALRQQTARLQEQLSSLLFADSQAAQNPPASASVPAVDAGAFAETTLKILEFAIPVPQPPAIVPGTPSLEQPIEVAQPAFETSQPAGIAPPPVKSLLDAEEDVKIPAWLEPLARNATAPTTTQELIEREKAKHAAALHTKHDLEELAAEPLPALVTEGPADLPMPTFGSDLPTFSSEVSSGGSKPARWLGLVAAALFIAAFGGWYFKQQQGPTQAARVSSPQAPPSDRSSSVPSQPKALPAPQSVAPSTSSSVQANPPANSNSLPATRNQTAPSGASAPAGAFLNANSKTEVARSPEPPEPAPQPKKPALGEVRLGAPTVNRNGARVDANDPEPAIEGSSDGASNAEALGSGILAGNSKQPVAPSAPLPVGGDVKAAKLLVSVPPVYSPLARAQHTSGDVKIDALIDATGHVTTMKVVSGPTLLHQSAMDALRQWKYQPATLDGKAVPMHLTVTLQFRMQQ